MEGEEQNQRGRRGGRRELRPVSQPRHPSASCSGFVWAPAAPTLASVAAARCRHLPDSPPNTTSPSPRSDLQPWIPDPRVGGTKDAGGPFWSLILWFAEVPGDHRRFTGCPSFLQNPPALCVWLSGSPLGYFQDLSPLPKLSSSLLPQSPGPLLSFPSSHHPRPWPCQGAFSPGPPNFGVS